LPRGHRDPRAGVGPGHSRPTGAPLHDLTTLGPEFVPTLRALREVVPALIGRISPTERRYDRRALSDVEAVRDGVAACSVRREAHGRVVGERGCVVGADGR